MNRASNSAINCDVQTCKHHNKNDAKCSLDAICVGKDHVEKPSEKTHTACSSFESHTGS